MAATGSSEGESGERERSRLACERPVGGRAKRENEKISWRDRSLPVSAQTTYNSKRREYILSEEVRKKL